MASLIDSFTEDTIMGQSAFVNHMRSLCDSWREEETHWENLYDSLQDPDNRDNVIHERNESFTSRMREMCFYLREHWNIVEQSPTLKDAVYFKVLEMCDLLPDFFNEGITFIEQMYTVG